MASDPHAPLEISAAGSRLWLLPERAVFWPVSRVLFVADLHLGKAAAFRAGSIPIPHGTTQATLDRLGEVVAKYQPDRLVILGDLWHARQGQTDSVVEQLCDWKARHSSLLVTLVTGNHDVKSGPTPSSAGITEVAEATEGPFNYLHHPEDREGRYVLCGHIHPGFVLSAALASVKIPCFCGEQVTWCSRRLGSSPVWLR